MFGLIMLELIQIDAATQLSHQRFLVVAATAVAPARTAHALPDHILRARLPVLLSLIELTLEHQRLFLFFHARARGRRVGLEPPAGK